MMVYANASLPDDTHTFVLRVVSRRQTTHFCCSIHVRHDVDRKRLYILGLIPPLSWDSGAVWRCSGAGLTTLFLRRRGRKPSSSPSRAFAAAVRPRAKADPAREPTLCSGATRHARRI